MWQPNQTYPGGIIFLVNSAWSGSPHLLCFAGGLGSSCQGDKRHETPQTQDDNRLHQHAYLVASDEGAGEAKRARDAGGHLLRGQLQEPHGHHDVQARLDERQQPLVRLVQLHAVLLVLAHGSHSDTQRDANASAREERDVGGAVSFPSRCTLYSSWCFSSFSSFFIDVDSRCSSASYTAWSMNQVRKHEIIRHSRQRRTHAPR
jgi:hypothetical protein|uniref:Uncharacterized protein n=1 Tax=Zea mays TaxID=4577 RepID=C0HJA1_MAIZE|nr:unknown [Zea mays]